MDTKNKDNCLSIKDEPLGNNLQELTSRFLEDLSLMESSRTTYGYGLKDFVKWAETESRTFSSLKKEDIRLYRADLRRRGLKEYTVVSYLQAIKAFYKWVEDLGIKKGISKDIIITRHKDLLKKRLVGEQSAVLLGKILESPDRNALRNYAIVNLILNTGLRTIEVCRLDIADMEMHEGNAFLKIWSSSRTRPDRTIAIDSRTYGPIEKYLKTRKGTRPRDPLFTTNGDAESQKGKRISPRSVQMICKQGLRAIGLEGSGYSAHSLRNTKGRSGAAQPLPAPAGEKQDRNPEDASKTELF